MALTRGRRTDKQEHINVKSKKFAKSMPSQHIINEQKKEKQPN